jgi:hypothetical protein
MMTLDPEGWRLISTLDYARLVFQYLLQSTLMLQIEVEERTGGRHLPGSITCQKDSTILYA